MVPFHMLRMVSYYCAIVTLSVKTHRFLDIRLQKARDLENRVKGLSRSLKISLFDRTHMTSITTYGWAYVVPFPRETAISLKISKFSHSFVFCAPR